MVDIGVLHSGGIVSADVASVRAVLLESGGLYDSIYSSYGN